MLKLDDSFLCWQASQLVQVDCDWHCADPPTRELSFVDACSVRFDINSLIEELFELILLWYVAHRALLVDKVTETSGQHSESYFLDDVLVSDSSQFEVIYLDENTPMMNLLLR